MNITVTILGLYDPDALEASEHNPGVIAIGDRSNTSIALHTPEVAERLAALATAAAAQLRAQAG